MQGPYGVITYLPLLSILQQFDGGCRAQYGGVAAHIHQHSQAVIG